MDIVTNIYDELNTRELSILLWLLIIIIFFSIKIKDDSIKNLAKAFFVKPILIITLCFFVYVLIEVVVFQKIGIWTKSSSKDVIWWIFFTGIFTISDFQKINNKKSYFQDTVKSFLKFTLILEFLVQLNTFSFYIEFFVIVPVISFLSVFLVFVENSDNENKNLIKRLLETILSILGIGILIYSTISLFQKIEELDFLEKTIEFLFPICLSIMFIPFVYLIWYYSRIEKLIFINQNFFANPKPSPITLLKVSIILRFNLTKIERWKDQALSFNLTTTPDLISEAYKIKETIKSEKFRVSAPLKKGWGIKESKEFLLDLDLRVGNYKQSYNEDREWSASSNTRTLDEFTGQNYITYYIYGEEIVVKKLRVVCSLNTKINPEKDFITIFSEAAQTLFKKAFIMQMPQNLFEDIKTSKPFKAIILGKIVSLEKDILSTNFGYHLRFCIENDCELNS